ncbi:MAG: right-handed parallel beta-helix repeat-containing protein, partial [Nitrososphaerota archaeon]|nr:right-handed parallel beta-helix repeat-containing protein [Nitrososphaerota archaeon]
ADAAARPRRRALKGASMLLIAASLIATLVVAGGAVVSRGGQPASAPPATSPAAATPLPPAAGCNYTLSLDGTTPVAKPASGARVVARGTDAGSLINSLLASHETICVTPGEYILQTDVEVRRLDGVTLDLAPGAVMRSTTGSGDLLVFASSGTVVEGGEWVGFGRGRESAIRIQHGSNGTVIQGTQVTRSGRDGVLVYDNTGTSYGVSILGDLLHGNTRFGVQVFSNRSTGPTGTTISGDVATDNGVGGIYTNGVEGVSIVGNVVANSEGNGPGEIGIGVTNGGNDTVSMNEVENMSWFGIQAYYNNHTVISYNISMDNRGSEDQSGITNDHSSFDTIVGNSVEQNGDYGVYLERSWNVTVDGNVATHNGGYGIGLYHGSLPAMGRATISGNNCSFNGKGGIILNSAVDNVISGNRCYDNSGYGILLYNDPGQEGSTGNLVFGNWLGNEGNAPHPQSYGIGEANASYGNTIVSNVFLNNTESAVLLVGGDGADPRPGP